MRSGQTFAIRYGLFRVLLSVMGLGPAFSGVKVSDRVVRVRMGWAFRAKIPVESIVSAGVDHGRVGGIGVHGFAGRWLVNGAASGLVAIEIKPRARAWMTGFPIRLRRLRVSVVDPEGLVAALSR